MTGKNSKKMVDLAIGTVQFGLDYGVTNSSGQTEGQAAGNILNDFLTAGYQWIDTAPAYGEAESLIGKYVSDKKTFFATKTPHCNWRNSVADNLELFDVSLAESLKALEKEPLDLLWLHQPEALNNKNFSKITDWFIHQKEKNKVNSIGVSIYQLESIIDWEDKLKNFDWIQAPCNILDQSIIANDVLAMLKNIGVSVQARSVFLQGLLVNPNASKVKIPSYVHSKIKLLAELATTQDCSVHQLCIDFIRNSGVHSAVFGITTPEEWEQLNMAWQQPSREIDYSAFSLNPDPWLNPASWS